jgi:hypothetical protein
VLVEFCSLGIVFYFVFAVGKPDNDRLNTFEKLPLPELNLSGVNLVQFGYLSDCLKTFDSI